MPTVEDVRGRLLEQMELILKQTTPFDLVAKTVLQLAEAHAWLDRPDQAHGK